jgi:hypothetical protein
VEYMQIAGNNNRPGRCSDDACPCGYPGAEIEYGKGYMYVSDEVVKFRMDCLTEFEAQLKIQSLFGGDRLVFAGQKGVFAPILMCNLGAKNRGINLDVAAKDAEHWWKTGKVPLRATPLADVNVVDNVVDVVGPAVSEPNYAIDNIDNRVTLLSKLGIKAFTPKKQDKIPLGDLQIGAMVMDPSWVWEFRTGKNYSGRGKIKPVTWIIVAKDHYEGLVPHVTLFAEELIGTYTFNNNTNPNRSSNNHWGESGTGNATHGLRPWLNSTGIHAGEGFYQAFSGSFKEAVLETTLPNKEWKTGSGYSTQDKVFIPSTTELCDTAHSDTYQIGTVFSHYTGARADKRVALFGGETILYWTRSPDSNYGSRVRIVNLTGEFGNNYANIDIYAVRPALNLKSEILVTEIRN